MTETKMWGGRFAKSTDKLVEDFHSSISFDQILYQHDIAGSIAHAKMLGKQGIISQAEAETLVAALQQIRIDIDAGQVEFEVGAEDIHMNIEKILTERVGEVGKKLHTARSRNDQVALDMRLYLKQQVAEVQELLYKLLQTLLDLAAEHKASVMAGYTHLQKAQPITMGHHLLAYFQMFRRDFERLTDCARRADYLPLGAGALAGTTFPIDRYFVAFELGFADICANTLDAVSDRDFVVEFISAASLIMVHLSRLSEEIVLWSSNEFGYITLDDGYSTGSSIMPQKKNPDFAELIRGKSGRVIGDLMALMVTVKSLPLAYNKDLQEDKEGAIDAANTLEDCYRCAAGMIATMQVNPDAMMAQAHKGYLAATDVADYLAKKGLPFRRAHEVVGHLVLLCEKRGCDLEDLTLDDFKAECDLFEADIAGALNLPAIVAARTTYGGTGHEAVRAQLAEARERLAADEAAIA